jgi:hypothetical protein
MTRRDLARQSDEPSEATFVIGRQGPPHRAYGVWGARAYAWSGEERPRAAGFPIDGPGKQRVLGFPGGLYAASEPDRLRHRRAPRPEARRIRLVVAVVAILGGRAAGRPPHAP